MIVRGITYLAILLIPLYTYGQNEFTIQYRTCTNCDGQLDNDNIQFQYGDVQDIQTSHISSDYGKRNHARAWHYGVDYNLEPADPDAGDHVLAIVAGTVISIDGGTGNFKYIRIDADGDDPDFGYGHIFRDGNATGGMRSGSFVLKELDDDETTFAIIFFPTTGQPVAISEVDGATVTYGEHPYTTTNRVTQGQPIAPYGRSGGTNVHLLDQNTRIEDLERKLEEK